MNRVRKDKLERASENWQNLVSEIMDMTEAELDALLDMERGRLHPRTQFLERIHQRLTKVRSQREREELLREAKR